MYIIGVLYASKFFLPLRCAMYTIAVLQAMGRLVDKGYTTFDLADHYGPAEDFVGEFGTRKQSQAAKGQVNKNKEARFVYLFLYVSHR